MAAMAGRFSYPRPNLIVSSDGFSVEVRGHNTILYTETDQTIEVFAEQVVIDEPTIIIRCGDIRVWQATEEITVWSRNARGPGQHSQRVRLEGLEARR